MGHRSVVRICVGLLALALLASAAPGSATSPSAGSPRGASHEDFVERGRTRRAAAARQAAGCGGPSDGATCRAFRPASAGDEAAFDTDRVVVGLSSKAAAN